MRQTIGQRLHNDDGDDDLTIINLKSFHFFHGIDSSRPNVSSAFHHSLFASCPSTRLRTQTAPSAKHKTNRTKRKRKEKKKLCSSRPFRCTCICSVARTISTSTALLRNPRSPRALQRPPQDPTLTRRRTAGSIAPRFPMANSENVSMAEIVAATEDEDNARFGFQRSEMYQSNLAGTVDPYERHVFLCFQSPDSWLPRVEESEADPLPKLLSSALKARKNDITVKTKLTICEAREGTFENGDVLIFPEMIKYKGLKDSEVNVFVDDVLVNGKPWAGGMQEALTGSHVFVCAHASRDKRCGVCGPILIEKLKEEIESRELKDQVFVSACSHVGGHKYAGNLIIYSPDLDGKITGHWYGYVTPDDVPEILDQHIGKGVLLERLWRGRMGASTKEGEKVSEQQVTNGEVINKSKKQEEKNIEANKVNMSSCCQGTSGFSGCRDGNLGASVEKKLKEKIEVHGNQRLAKLSSWIGSLEQSDILAAVAVVGAVTTVSVAYGICKRSG